MTKSLSEGTSPMLSLRVTREIMEALARLAESRHTTVSAIVRAQLEATAKLAPPPG